MTDSQSKQVREIQALLAERRKYEEWLAQLEARKTSTPEHVYAKVHGDYAVRLTEAQAKLTSETGALQTLAAELESSLEAHERRAGEKTDERAEAELRASVGEYAEKEWDKLRAKLDAAITDLMGERDACKRELETLQALLAETAGPGSPGHAEPPPPPAAPASLGKVSDAPALRGPAAAAKPAESAPAPAATAAEAASGKKSDVDELAFLRSVLGRTTPYTGAGGHPAIPEPQAVPAPEPRKSGAARVSGVQPARPSGAPRAPEPEPELFTLAEPAAPLPEPGAAPPDSESTGNAPRASGAFGAPTPRTSEAVRSLKCQECGTLNFPTEWYCERCGGELAAF